MNKIITLEKIDEEKFEIILAMKLSEEQNKFVAPNILSLAEAWLHYNEARPFAICLNRKVIGFIMLNWDENERTVGIWRFMIASEYQGHGYGRKAIEIVIEMVKKNQNIDLIHLDFVEGNKIARDLYYSLGFRENGDIEDDEIVMTMKMTDNPKVGIVLADEDDINELDEHINNKEIEFNKKDIEELITNKGLYRITLFGDTIGLATKDKINLLEEYKDYFIEAKNKIDNLVI